MCFEMSVLCFNLKSGEATNEGSLGRGGAFLMGTEGVSIVLGMVGGLCCFFCRIGETENQI